MIRSLGSLALMHLGVNALLLWLGYYWLGVGESRTSMLLWSICVAVATIALGCWGYGTAFAYFQADNDRRLPLAWRTALRNLLPLTAAAMVVVLVYVLLARGAEYSSTPAFQIASFLTLQLRKPVHPASVLRVFHLALWVTRWVVLPVIFVPMISAISMRGWDGFRSVGDLFRRRLYWIEGPLLTLSTLWFPLKLILWVPHTNGFGMEMLSFVFRAGLAYLLFAGAGLLLVFVTSGGSPRFTQSKTLASP